MFKETGEVGFDKDGWAVHKPCGTRLSEWWSVSRDEEYSIMRDGTIVLVPDGGDDKDCDGVTCDTCDVRVTLECDEEDSCPHCEGNEGTGVVEG